MGERSSPAVLQSSWRKVICTWKQRTESWKGQSISRLMQCVCVSVCVWGTVRVVVCSFEAECEVMGGNLFFTLDPSKEKLFSSTPHSGRIVEMLPRRADLSLPVGTYLSPSLFLRLPLKGGCFNLRYTSWRSSWVSAFTIVPRGCARLSQVEENMTTFSKQNEKERKDFDMYSFTYSINNLLLFKIQHCGCSPSTDMSKYLTKFVILLNWV